MKSIIDRFQSVDLKTRICEGQPITKNTAICLFRQMSQETLREMWLHAPGGRLSAWQQALAVGLREASRELHGGSGNFQWIAERLTNRTLLTLGACVFRRNSENAPLAWDLVAISCTSRNEVFVGCEGIVNFGKFGLGLLRFTINTPAQKLS